MVDSFHFRFFYGIIYVNIVVTRTKLMKEKHIFILLIIVIIFTAIGFIFHENDKRPESLKNHGTWEGSNFIPNKTQ